jgi:hypothetical protein
MNKIISFLIILISLCGCISYEPKVETIKTWENHYFTTNDFYKATENIKLEKGESIWVLSNSTLSRLLRNIKEK